MRDPWAIHVSEVMLQQTQVSRVEPLFAAFLERFPTVTSCAAAPVGAVIERWHGLGYNRRAVHLHRCAVEVTTRHGGVYPPTIAELRALPGIGPYTARAILAFAFEQDVGVVDTNAARVLARWAGRRLTASGVQRAADEAVPDGEGWAWNQAMLDLGATICRPGRPRCEKCPVTEVCAWRGEGDDPAVGSAGVSGGQSRFAGSDRQGRGRLVAALRTGPVAESELATVMGWPHDEDRARRVAAGVVADGLASVSAGWFSLP